MRKLTKALSVILALSMILTAFTLTAIAETTTTTYSVDFANLTDENDNFKFYKGTWGDSLFTSLAELTGTYTYLTGETNIIRVNYFWTEFNLSDTENPAAELNAGDKLYWTILNWNVFQAVVTNLSVVGTYEVAPTPSYTAAISADPTDVSRDGNNR